MASSLSDLRDDVTENHKSSLMKALSWRVLGTLTTFFATLSLTHSLNVATVVGVIEFASKILLFYLHERVWIKINRFLRKKAELNNA